MSEVHDIAKIKFGILSADFIKKMAVCKVDNSKVPNAGSVYDEKMGSSLDTQIECVTCGLKKECPGHFGYIQLVEPVLHPMFYKMVSLLLKCFCKQCYRLLLLPDQIEISGLNKLFGRHRFDRIIAKVEDIDICCHCSSPQPKINFKSKDMTIAMEYKQKKEGNKISVILSVEDIQKIFNHISNEDVELLGLDPNQVHPKDFIISVLPVIPPCSRPYIITDGNMGDDDLTYQLIEIVKIQNQLSQGDLSDTKLQKLRQALTFRVQTMMNNTKGRAKHPTDKRTLKGYKERLGGKSGRIRNNLMGKRVDFSARTVIGAEPTLKLNQVAIPNKVAEIHTFPEYVQAYNIDWLTHLVNTGQASSVITTKEGSKQQFRINLQVALNQKGTKINKGDIIIYGPSAYQCRLNNIHPDKIDTKKICQGDEELQQGDQLFRKTGYVEVRYPKKREYVLKHGDIVERKLQKGDIVLFNRYPTLHKGSMMGMEVVPMKHDTFRFNLASTTSFNADFDGDEMNTHVPQSYESKAELLYLSSTELNIVTPQESKSVIGIKQDSLIGAYLMTKTDHIIGREKFLNLLMCVSGIDGKDIWSVQKFKRIESILKSKGKKFNYSSRQLISFILPETFFYQKKNNIQPEPTVIIEQGVYLEGTLDKSILGAAHYSILQLLQKEYGTSVVANFIDNMQFLTNNWLLLYGFSVGLEDCMITSEESVLAIKDTLAQCYTKAKGIEETTYNAGIREVRVTASLSQAKDVGMRIAKDAMRPDNNFLTTVISGAKGDYFNIAQLTGLLGQQNLEGKRVQPMLNHGKRTLPHYPFGQLDREREYESRGFVRNSFIHGLTPEEFIFHAMSGREGVIDTAMGTAKTGYVQRKIVKVFEDIAIQNDGTVRDRTSRLFQFCYGDNNYDPTKTLLVNNEPQICDISRIVRCLNNCHENKIELPNISFKLPTPPDYEYKEIIPYEPTQKELDNRKKKLIKKLRKKDDLGNLDEYTLEELEQRMNDYVLQEIESDDEKEEVDDEEEEDDDEEEEDDDEEEEYEEDDIIDDEPDDFDEEDDMVEEEN